MGEPGRKKFWTATVRGARILLEPGHAFLVGRHSSCHVYLPDGTVSRFHGAVFTPKKGEPYYVDVGTQHQGSTNGSWLDGKRVEPLKKIFLKHGMEIRMNGERSGSRYVGSPEHDPRDYISILFEQHKEMPAGQAQESDSGSTVLTTQESGPKRLLRNVFHPKESSKEQPLHTRIRSLWPARVENLLAGIGHPKRHDDKQKMLIRQISALLKEKKDRPPRKE